MFLTRGCLGPKSRFATASCLVALLGASPGCFGGSPSSPPPPAVDDTARGSRPAPRPPQAPDTHQGMSTTSKVVLLGGAAALYYMYRKHQNSTAQGEAGQYYLSKNGRVYYRDAEHRAHWVTPPSEGLSVPESEAREYSQFQGYNNQPTGRDLTGLASDNP